jgi:nicotinate-nucleotide pyrophosphorylase (carboxylating)
LEKFNSIPSSMIGEWLKEDGFEGQDFYFKNLPSHNVECQLNFKSEMVVAGLDYFFSVFEYLLNSTFPNKENFIKEFEGKKITNTKTTIKFNLPFNVAITGERLALNLLQKASAVATHTDRYVLKIEEFKKSKKLNSLTPQWKILDTRKTTPGLRSLEKYAVRVGGGFNHRFSQVDCWMIKDNHKKHFGSLTKAYEWFKNLGAFYTPIICEIHSFDELTEAKKLNIQSLLLDHFSKDQLIEAVKIKSPNMTYEVSGGINLSNIENFLIDGVDGFSVGEITQNPPRVDVSLKIL